MEIIDQDLFETNNFSNYEEASKGKRLANAMIDLFSFYLLIFILTFTLGIIQSITHTDLLSWLNNIDPLVDRLLTSLFLVLYLSLMENVFSGRTLGKFITKTKAVNEDGSVMNGNETMIRNFYRLIPLDALSFLFSYRGWHDKFSKTMVVDLNMPLPHENSTPEN